MSGRPGEVQHRPWARKARLWARALLCAAALLCARLAEAQGAKAWALVYAAGLQSSEAEVQARLAELEAALRDASVEVVADMSERVEGFHSRRLTQPDPERVAALHARLEALTQHLALGELSEALAQWQALDSEPEDMLDALNRDRARAKRLFSACVTTAYALHGEGERSEANQRARRCADRFPSFELAPSEFSSEMRLFFQEATLQASPTWLSVESSAPDRACNVRLNGVDVGRAPLRTRARTTAARLVLECGETPRVHMRELQPGENNVRIDPDFDGALQAAPPWVYLRYPADDALGAALAHAIELGRVLSASELLLVQEGTPLRLRRLSVATGAIVAQSEWSGDRAELQGRIAALFRSSTAPPAVARPAIAARPPAPKTATGWFELTPADPALFVALSGLWLASVATSAVLLDARSDLRLEGVSVLQRATPETDVLTNTRLQALGDEYNTKAWAAVLVAGAVDGLVVTSALLALPRYERPPWWAWALGGAGAAMAVAGVVTSTAVDSCSITDPSEGCQSLVRDPLFGPLLLIHSAAPLSVGLTYILSQLGGRGLDVAVHTAPGGSSVHVQGRF